MAYMSQEGYDKLIAELRRLEGVERPKASAAIAEARDKGDLSENSEYDAAKEAQAHLEDKINRLKVEISEAKVVDTSRLSTDAVQILSKVEMTNLANKAKMTYTIVSESEANLREGKISITTPIAQGLLNHKVGDEVEVKVPRGTIKLRIDQITVGKFTVKRSPLKLSVWIFSVRLPLVRFPATNVQRVISSMHSSTSTRW